MFKTGVNTWANKAHGTFPSCQFPLLFFLGSMTADKTNFCFFPHFM